MIDTAASESSTKEQEILAPSLSYPQKHQINKSKDIQGHLYHSYSHEHTLRPHEQKDLKHRPFSNSEQPLYNKEEEEALMRFQQVSAAAGISSAATQQKSLPIRENLISDEHLVFKDSEMIVENDLRFFSKFESGNLEKVWKVPEEASQTDAASTTGSPSLVNHQYVLAMHFDTNTTNHSQWFYFGVEGMKSTETYQFFIINCIKGKKSMFSEGMKVCAYSEYENAGLSPQEQFSNHFTDSSQGWNRVGTQIRYYQNNYSRPESMVKKFWTLQFNYSPPRDNDVFYFTQGVPYTHSYLQRYLSHLEANLGSRRDMIFKRELLCHTAGGNRCDMLTITSKEEDDEDSHSSDHQDAATLDLPATETASKQKDYIVFSARVHPGETQASHMMHGTLRFLTSDDQRAVELRRKYVFFIVPMLNPDGCQAGNYRTNLHGFDLNRTWREPDIVMHPTIYHTKQLIQRVNSKRPVLLYVDFHGHARKKNIFIYGCNSKIRRKMLNMRVYPHIVARRSHLSFADCKFNLFKSKMGAARCAVYKAFDIDNSYTIEASLCGPSHRRVHYGTEDYQEQGASLPRSLLTYEIPEERAKSYEQLDRMFPEKKKTPLQRRKKSRLENRFGRGDTNFFENRTSGVEIHVKSKETKSAMKQRAKNNTTTSSEDVKSSESVAKPTPKQEPALISIKSLLISSALLVVLRYLWKLIFGF